MLVENATSPWGDCRKRIDMLGGHSWRSFFMACSKLEAMAIYVVKQACDNEIIRVCIDINSIYSRKGLLPMSYPWFLPHFLLICGF